MDLDVSVFGAGPLVGVSLAYLAFFLSALSPGPNILGVMGVSMSVDRGAGLAMAMGVATGSFVWALVTASGLTALLTAYAGALTVIKIAGGLYLLWLAVKAFRAAARPATLAIADNGDALSARGYYLRGLTVQLTNPKAALAWIAIMALGMPAGAPLWAAAAIVIGTTVLSVVMHGGYALLFSSPPAARLYARGRRAIQAGLGAFFAFAGLKLLTSRI